VLDGGGRPDIRVRLEAISKNGNHVLADENVATGLGGGRQRAARGNERGRFEFSEKNAATIAN
jgi:hypothetical protein